MSNFEKVKNYLLDLGHEIVQEHTEDELLLVSDANKGICNLILDCEGSILILEQHIFDIDPSKSDIYKKLLQINRLVVHGAFVLDDSGERVLFRDTLQLSTLDINELEASINALSLALSENLETFLEYAA